MTVKKRISLFIIGAGLITSLMFSIFVFAELIEQSFDVLDKALRDEAYSMTRMFVKQKKELELETIDSEFIPGYLYWLEITEQDSNKLLYKSKMADIIELKTVEPDKRAVETVKISRDIINLHQNKSQKVTFRIRSFLIDEGGKTFVVQIARSMRTLSREILQLVFGLIYGFIFSTIILVVLSKVITKKILKPIGTMKDLTENINEKHLARRIPVQQEKDEFNELARTINKMLDRLQNSFVAQRAFLFDTSHELKTPLTTMRLTIDDLCSNDAKALPGHTKKTLSVLNDQVLRMERLVKDLLSLSSLETLTGIDLKPVNLTEILFSLRDDYGYMAEAKNISMDIKLSSRHVIQGDREKLIRTFSNLFDNAIKYNVDKGRIKVTSSESKGNIIIRIGNTGPGVPENKIDNVFDQFYRADKSRSILSGGFGLGLAIVRRAVELHNGDITFKSKTDVWTEVTITFPLSKDILTP